VQFVGQADAADTIGGFLRDPHPYNRPARQDGIDHTSSPWRITVHGYLQKRIVSDMPTNEKVTGELPSSW
jgi:hypothetical protein